MNEWRTGKAAVRSAKLNSGQDFSVESGRVSVKRWVFATAPPSPPFFLSFLVGNLEADVDPAPSVADPETSVVRAIRLGSLIWLALSCLPLPRAGSPFLSPHTDTFFFSLTLYLFSHQVCVCASLTRRHFFCGQTSSWCYPFLASCLQNMVLHPSGHYSLDDDEYKWPTLMRVY